MRITLRSCDNEIMPARVESGVIDMVSLKNSTPFIFFINSKRPLSAFHPMKMWWATSSSTLNNRAASSAKEAFMRSSTFKPPFIGDQSGFGTQHFRAWLDLHGTSHINDLIGRHDKIVICLVRKHIERRG